MRSLNRTPELVCNNRRGAVAVEFALVAPLVLMVLFGLIEFTRFNLIRHTANNAAYEAARNTMVPGATQTEAAELAAKVLARLGVRNARVVVTPSVITESTPAVRVDVFIPMKDNSWGIMRFLGRRTIQTSCVLRTERAPMVQAQSLPTAPVTVSAPPSTASTPSTSTAVSAATKPSTSGSSTSSTGSGSTSKTSSSSGTSTKPATTSSSTKPATSSTTSSSTTSSSSKTTSPPKPGL